MNIPKQATKVDRRKVGKVNHYTGLADAVDDDDYQQSHTSPSTAEPTERAVDAALASLNSEISRLESLLGTLSHRLGPVLAFSEDPDNQGDIAMKDIGTSPLSAKLTDAMSNLYSLNSRIADLIQGLEI